MILFKQNVLLFNFFAILIFCLNIKPFSAKANGITAAAADLSYTFIGLNAQNEAEYEIKLNLYYHCITNDDIANLSLANIYVNSFSCATDIEIELALQETDNVTPLCPQNENDSNCDSGDIGGMMRFTYSNATKPLTLACEAEDWTLHFSEIFRNPEITNFQNSDDESLYIKAIINNSDGQNYSSPQFDELKMPYFCKNIPSTLNQNVTSGNALNISYESVAVLGSNGQDNSYPLTYQNGFSPQNPLSTSNYNFNNNTGEIQFTASEIQNSVLAIWVEERYENGHLIAATMRNIQIVVVECDNQPISIDAGQTSYGITPNGNLNFNINVSDLDADDNLSITTNITSNFPSEATINMTGSDNNLLLNFDWTPTENDEGLYYLVVHAQDNHCPIMSYQVWSIPIFVTCDIITEAENFIFCQNISTEMEINLQGGSPFFWQPEPQNLSENGAKAIISPTENTNYTITNNCGTEKNISINLFDGFSLSNFSDLRLCQNETTTLEPLLSPNQNYDYTWTSSLPLDCPNCPTIDILATETASYTLNVIDDFGCEITETINIEVEKLPEITILASSLKVLKGQNVSLEIVGEGFETISWNNGNSGTQIEQIINETNTFTATATSINGCTTTKSITIEAICEAPPIPTAFSPNEDGINDSFGISYFDFQSFGMKIYDRWGKLIFETNDQSEDWNGKHQNRVCNIGIYVYVIQAKMDCESAAFPNGELILKGNISLIR